MSDKKVVVQFKTRKIHCNCCGQKLPKAKTSDVREFEIGKQDALNWADWQAASEFPEDIENMVPEFVYEIIRFYSVNSEDRLLIEDDEIEKVKAFILQEVIAGDAETICEVNQ